MGPEETERTSEGEQTKWAFRGKLCLSWKLEREVETHADLRRHLSECQNEVLGRRA